MPNEIEVKIKEVIRRTHNVKSIRVETEGSVAFKAGQFLSVSLRPQKEFKRYLSISSSPTETGYIEFTKKLTDSDFSRALDALKAGDRVNIQYPMGKFTLEDSVNKIAFLSGGIGITPIRSMAKYAADMKLDKDMVLLYSNRTIDDIAFRDELEVIQKQYPKFKVVHILCEAHPGFSCVSGIINSGLIKKEIPDYKERLFYLCGPPGMVEEMKRMLSQELGLAQDKIITENFQGY